MALPPVLLAGALLVQDGIPASISHFYYTQMADFFVGILCAIGVFLFAYKSYDSESYFSGLSHKLVARTAGIGAIGLALVPTHTENHTESADLSCSLVHCLAGMKLGSDIHHIFAGMFFISLALFCLVLFIEKSPDGRSNPTQRKRNLIYRSCGVILLVAMALLVTYRQSPVEVKAWMDAHSYQFWIESIGVWAFGLSWLVHGRAIWFLNETSNTPPAEPGPALNLVRKLIAGFAPAQSGTLARSTGSVVVDISVPEFDLPFAHAHDAAQNQPGHQGQHREYHQRSWQRSGHPYGYRATKPEANSSQPSANGKAYENIAWSQNFQNGQNQSGRNPNPAQRPH